MSNRMKRLGGYVSKFSGKTFSLSLSALLTSQKWRKMAKCFEDKWDEGRDSTAFDKNWGQFQFSLMRKRDNKERKDHCVCTFLYPLYYVSIYLREPMLSAEFFPCKYNLSI